MSSNLKVNTILPSTGDTVSIAGIASITSNVSIASSCTASTFFGSGANLTGITQTTINNNANNRVITGSGTANTLEGESGLTYSSNNLYVTNAIILPDDGTTHYGVADTAFVRGKDSTDGYLKLGTNGSERLRITSDGKLLVGATSQTNGSIAEFSKSVAGGAAGCHITVENTSTNSVNNTAGIHLKTNTGTAKFFKYQANQTFLQSAAGGASELILQASGAHPMRLYTDGDERVRITKDGEVNIGGDFAQSNYKLSVYTASSASIIAKSASSNHQTANIWCHNDTANWLALGVWGSAGNTAGLITANSSFESEFINLPLIKLRVSI